METLDKVVDFFVNTHFKRDHTDLETISGSHDDFSTEDVKIAFADNIKKRIIDEITDQKKNEIDEYTKKVVEEERKKSSIIAIKELMWEAFVLAIFVGLLCNEISTLIEFFKGFGGLERHTLITVILIVVFASIVLVLYIVKFTKDIIKTFIKTSK